MDEPLWCAALSAERSILLFHSRRRLGSANSKSKSMIEHIYIAGYRRDFYLTRLCVASIRYWYPQIPITFIKDYNSGDYDTSELEDWDVRLFPSAVKKFGYGYGKFEPLFLPERQQYLMLDSDTVLVGPVLDFLNQTNADFIIHPERSYYTYDLNLLKAFDPGFSAPDFTFNSGQYVATSGLLQRSDFERVLAWTEPRASLYPDIFKENDQLLFNYLLFKGRAEGRFSVVCRNFYIWADGAIPILKLEMIRRRTSPAMVLHWAGYKSEDFSQMPRADILNFFRDYYLSRTTLASSKTSA